MIRYLLCDAEDREERKGEWKKANVNLQPWRNGAAGLIRYLKSKFSKSVLQKLTSKLRAMALNITKNTYTHTHTQERRNIALSKLQKPVIDSHKTILSKKNKLIKSIIQTIKVLKTILHWKDITRHKESQIELVTHSLLGHEVLISFFCAFRVLRFKRVGHKHGLN